MSAYGGISTEAMMKKYEVTSGLVEDHDEMMDDFYRNTLTNRGPDKTTFASDEKRSNTHSVGKLNLFHSGNRSNNEPVHYDTFLGFTEKDPRGTSTGPDMRRHADQLWHRKKNYKKAFKSDADPSIPSEGVNQKKAIENIRAAQFASKGYRKIFSTGTDGIHRGYNGMPDSKPIGKKIENTNVIADLNDINNITNRRDWTTEKSFDVPLGYMGTPDHKFKVAKYGSKGKTPNIYNMHVRKNKGEAVSGGKDLVEHKGNIITKALQLAMSDIIKNRKKNQDPSFNDQLLGKSSKAHSRQTNKNIIDKTEESKNIIKSQAKAKLDEELNKNFNTAADNKDLLKNKQQAENDLIHGKINQSEGINKKAADIESFISGQLMDKIIQDHDKKNDNKGNNKNAALYSHVSPKLCENMNKSKYNTHIQKEGVQKKDPDEYSFHKYKNKAPTNVDTVGRDAEGFDMMAVIKKSTDKITQARQLAQIGHENNNKDNVTTEQGFNISGTKNRKTGKKIKANMMKNMDIDHEQDMTADKERIIYSKK